MMFGGGLLMGFGILLMLLFLLLPIALVTGLVVWLARKQ